MKTKIELLEVDVSEEYTEVYYEECKLNLIIFEVEDEKRIFIEDKIK